MPARRWRRQPVASKFHNPPRKGVAAAARKSTGKGTREIEIASTTQSHGFSRRRQDRGGYQHASPVHFAKCFVPDASNKERGKEVMACQSTRPSQSFYIASVSK